MKLILVSLFLLPVSAFALQLGKPEFKKALDGKTIFCAQDSDIGKAGYGLTGISVESIGHNELGIDLRITHVRCAEYAGEYFWEDRNPMEPIDSKDIFGNPIRIWQRDISSALTNFEYKLIGLNPVDEANLLGTSFRVPVSKVMDSRRRRDLDNGQSVQVTMKYFQRSIVTIERNGKMIPVGMKSGGSYFIRFNLLKDANGLNVSQVQLR